MSTIAEDIREKMMNLLLVEEQRTDLENLAVLSRVGMKVASATSAELDADATSASSTALIDLGLRLSEATSHGGLLEIILHNASGYSILMAINDEYIVFSGLTKVWRIGFYLGYLRELTKKLKIMISGDEVTETALRLEESELEKIRQQQQAEEEASSVLVVPTVEQDKAALDDLLGFLDEWENEGDLGETLEVSADSNVVGIPKALTVGIPETGGTVGLSDEGSLLSEDELELDLGLEVGLPESKATPEFKVYDDEVPPVPLEDYTPMEIDDGATEEIEYAEPTAMHQEPMASKSEYIYESPEGEPEELPSLDQLPSFDELAIPDFDSGTEYDTEFVLEEEGESLDKVLHELGWQDDE